MQPCGHRCRTPPAHAAANAAAASFAALMAKLDYLSTDEVEQVRRAYRLADEAHLGQLRSSGEPYITHPVAELVDGLTKLDKLQFDTREENQAESFRKMLLAMARDVRVILIKLADRSHNMRTLSDMPVEKWRRIASETLDIYVPIANRLGLNQTYRELQDLSFRHLMPWRYKVLEKAISRARNRRRDVMKKVQHEVEAIFRKTGLPMQITGREKTLHSIYKKMDTKNLSFAQVNDLYGFRLILGGVTECYTALGLLHQLYKPVPGRFKDHIAIAKLNGYQSLIAV